MSDFIPHDIHQPHLICSFCSLEHPSRVTPPTQPPASPSCSHAPAEKMHFSALDSAETVAG